jgi:dephospho-CoA kinase
MYRVGLTGNLYSGIYEISDIFREKGIPVFDADVVLKFILNWEQDTIRDIRIQFSSEVFSAGFLKESSFNTDQKINRLIDVAKDKLMNRYRLYVKKNPNAKFVVFKSHFLFESGFDKYMDFKVSTHCPKEERVKKLKTEANVMTYLAQEYLEAEMPENAKNKLSNFIINNSDNSGSISEQIDFLINKISEKQAMKL